MASKCAWISTNFRLQHTCCHTTWPQMAHSVHRVQFMTLTISSKDDLRFFLCFKPSLPMNSQRWLIYFHHSVSPWLVSSFRNKWNAWISCLLLTPLFGLFTNWSLVRLKVVWVELTRWIAAFDKAPTSLLFGDYARIKGIVTEGCIGRIGWTSPTSKCGRWKSKRKKKQKQTNYYHEHFHWFEWLCVCPWTFKKEFCVCGAIRNRLFMAASSIFCVTMTMEHGICGALTIRVFVLQVNTPANWNRTLIMMIIRSTYYIHAWALRSSYIYLVMNIWCIDKWEWNFFFAGNYIKIVVYKYPGNNNNRIPLI